MKENDVNDIKVINNGKNEYKEMYDKLSDITSRLQFIIDARIKNEAIKARGNEVSQEDKDNLLEVEAYFISKYIAGGSKDIHKTIINYLDKIKKNSEKEYETLYKQKLSSIDSKDRLRKQKAKWLTDQTGVRIDNNVINEVIGTFNDALSGTLRNNLTKDQKAVLENANSIEPSSEKGIEEWINKEGNKKIRSNKKKDLVLRTDNLEQQYKHRLKHSGTDFAFHKKVSDHYRGLKTMEQKLELIVDYNAYISAQSLIYDSASTYGSVVEALFDDFMDTYFRNGTPEMNKKVFKALGNISADSKCRLLKENEECLVDYSNEGDIGVKKADQLSWNTAPGYYAQSVRLAEMQLRFFFVNHSKNEKNINEIWNSTGINMDTTVEEYARIIGKTGNELTQYLNKIGAESKDTRMIDIFKRDKGDISDKVALSKFKDDYMANVPKRIVYSVENEVCSKRLAESQQKHYAEITEKLNGELSQSKIKEWLKGEGKKLIDNNINKAVGQVMNDFSKKYFGKLVDYEQYIRLHTGYAITKDTYAKKVDYLSKAIAANILRKSNVKFSIDKIHKVANGIKASENFVNFMNNTAAMEEALTDMESINKTEFLLFGKPFMVDKQNVCSYLHQMSTLFENMMPSEGRSREYTAFYNAVKKVYDINGNFDFNDQADMQAAIKTVSELNMNLVNAAKAYIKDKEKVRSSNDGVRRFDNAIDALAIVAKHTPGVEKYIKTVEKDINLKRKAQKGSSKYLDMEEYGAKRAQRANVKKEHSKAPAMNK